MNRLEIALSWMIGSVMVLLALVLLSAVPPAPAAASSAAPDLTTTPSPTPSPTATPVFSATLNVVPDRPFVEVGEMLAVTLSVEVVEGCEYPVFETRLTQSGPSAPNFTYVDPVTDTVGPPVTMPFTFHLLATTPGEVTLNGRLYGEQNCGQAWIWTYVSGSSPLVTILSGAPSAVFLPWVAGAALPETRRTRH